MGETFVMLPKAEIEAMKGDLQEIKALFLNSQEQAFRGR
jgi:hypothetical protein